jgi:hypothetical protein
MKKRNCWEFMKCGREVGGDRTVELGICSVSSEFSADGLNGGINGGRICWIIDENGCNSNLMHRFDYCFQCEFRYRVMNEEGLINVCKTTGFFLRNLSDRKDLSNQK